MRDWSFWDWAGYSALGLAIMWGTIDQLLKSDVSGFSSRIRPMFDKFPRAVRRVAPFLPLILFIFGTCVFVIRAITFHEDSDPVTKAEKYEGSPIGFAWNSARLDGYIPANDQFHIQALTMSAKNLSNSPITISDASVISARDSTKVHMRIGGDYGAWLPNEINPIPPQAEIFLTASLGEAAPQKNEGIKESEFTRKWSPFFVVIEYEGKTIRHEFNGDWIVRNIKSSMEKMTRSLV